MSPIEETCRWSIVAAYGLWRLDHHKSRLGMVAYARALGVEPTDPPRGKEEA
jgi:hypothetical protein